MRRALRILSVALITAGLVIAADIAMTLLWREPVSTVYGAIKQGQAADSLDRLERSFQAIADEESESGGGDRDEERPPSRELIRRFVAEIETGEGIGRIRIPAIDVETVVVEGTDTASLQKGPGHYSNVGDLDEQGQDDGSAFPGQGRTVGIAGHRTTYLAPFREIEKISPGDRIVVEMPYGDFTYEVQGHKIVEPSEVGIVRDVGYERLVLTACHPLYSAAERWAVFAKLVEPLP